MNFLTVSAGFDAADGDDLGECHVSPTGYAHMTHMLSSLAGGKLVVALEVCSQLRFPSALLTTCPFFTTREAITSTLYQILRWQLPASCLGMLRRSYPQ